jgi:hypothetical protein
MRLRPCVLCLASALQLRSGPAAGGIAAPGPAAPPGGLPEAITQALGTEIESVADVLAREKEIIANAEASKKDAEQEAVDATGDDLAAIQKKIKEYEDEIETAAQVIEEAEAMKSSAEAHIVALQQAEEQKAKLKDAVSHQVNVTTSNFSMELSKLLNRADRDPLTACLNKVNELDQQFASLLASKVNGTNGSNGAGFHIAIMIDSSKIHGPVAPDMASFGHFVPQAELAHNVTGTDGGGEADGDVWLPPWPTADGPVALVEKNRCRVAVEKLQHKYNLNLEDLASGLGKQ